MTCVTCDTDSSQNNVHCTSETQPQECTLPLPQGMCVRVIVGAYIYVCVCVYVMSVIVRMIDIRANVTVILIVLCPFYCSQHYPQLANEASLPSRMYNVHDFSVLLYTRRMQYIVCSLYTVHTTGIFGVVEGVQNYAR